MRTRLLRSSFVCVLALVLGPLACGAEWKTLRDCRYLPNAANDGDSFHVRAEGKEYIFRLYFVDAPETDSLIPARLAEQAKYFRVGVPETLQIGREAERFTRQKLARPFIVRTCLQDARGRSRLPRYFAFVEVDDADLSESLVANGLARVYGAASDPPEMDKAAVQWRKLQEFERKAQEQKVGGWGIGFGRLNMRSATQPGPSSDSFDSFFHRKPAGDGAAAPAAGGKLNVNTASMTSLQDIPGLGSVLAKRIVNGRPYQTADDLRRVKGVGPKLTKSCDLILNNSLTTSQSEYGTITELVVKHPRGAFGSAERIAAEWKALNFTDAPDFAGALEQFDSFLERLRASDCEIISLPEAGGVGMDSIYVRDAAIVCDRGVILCRMGKAPREGEPAVQEAAFRALGLTILGTIQPPGKLEGGDVVWLDRRTLAVGRGYRTNDSGIAQLRAFLEEAIDELITVELPHWRGPADVFHLMSIVSPVDRDLAVVYSPLMSVPFREQLLARGFTLVEVPDEEFESMGANVLALGPRRCLMVAGNPVTRARLEAAGAEVQEYAGSEISLKGGGGPTCLTRPLQRKR